MEKQEQLRKQMAEAEDGFRMEIDRLTGDLRRSLMTELPNAVQTSGTIAGIGHASVKAPALPAFLQDKPGRNLTTASQA